MRLDVNKYNVNDIMIIKKQILKPANWDDFEHLCKRLWGELWNCNDRIKRHGRQGQVQHGVDIYAYCATDNGYCGIQCKGKDEYTHAQLTKGEIETEIQKAKSFTPPLKRLIFATTANKDATIEEFVREKDIENINQGLFSVELYQWEDIVDLFEIAPLTHKWYINNCQYVQTVDIKLSIEVSNEEVAILRPTFLRKIRRYRHQDATSNYTNGFPFFHMDLPKLLPQVINHALCEVVLFVENVGNTTIEDYKIKIEFDKSEVKKVDNLVHFSIMDSENLRQIKIENQTVFEYSNDDQSLICQPKKEDSVLVEKDINSFKFAVEPVSGLDKITLKWMFLSRGYSNEGVISIPVEASFKDEYEYVNVDDEESLLTDEIISIDSYVEDVN